MERTLVFPAATPVPRGNRVEVVQVRDDEADAGAVLAVRDLNRGISYRLRDSSRERVDVWRAVVRDCSIIDTAHGAQTTLTVVSADPVQDAADALEDADAAAAAAKAESDRWGGADRPPPVVPDRFW